MVAGTVYYLAGSYNSIFNIKEDKDTSLIEICSYLVRNGAREVKEPLQVAKYIEIIQNLLTNEMDREYLLYDTLDLLYNAFVIMAPKDRWLEGVLALLENEKFNYKYKRLLSQLTPRSVTSNYLNELVWSYEEKRGDVIYEDHFEFMAFGAGKTVSHRLKDVIDDAIGSAIYDYIISNYSLKIYYRLNNGNYWYQHKPFNLKQQNLPVISGTTIIFNHQGEDCLITISKSLASTSNSDIIEGMSLRLFSRDMEYFISRALKSKSLIIEATTDTPIVIPPHKITNRVFPIETFNIKADCTFMPKSILEENRVGILCFGKPGTGKTSYVYSLYHHVLKDEGYILLNLGYQEYLNLPTNPNTPLKAVVLVNDADSIETEENRAKVLNRLESSIFKKTITFLTVNDTSKLDAALTRKGRIDYHLYFEEFKSHQNG